MMKLVLETELMMRETPDGTRLMTPNEVESYLEAEKSLAQEAFIVLTLNTKNQLIKKHLVSLGTVNSTLVEPREVFRPAILDAATFIIVAHNHPSGDASPSSNDIRLTRQLIEASKVVGIPLLDHVIVAANSTMSLRESGLLAFE